MYYKILNFGYSTWQFFFYLIHNIINSSYITQAYLKPHFTNNNSLQFIYALDISGTPGNYTFSGPLVTILHLIEKHLGQW